MWIGGDRAMRTIEYGGPRRLTARLVMLAVIGLAAILLWATQAGAGGRAAGPGAGLGTSPVGGAVLSMAPLNPAFLASLLGSPVGAPSSAIVGQALGERPGPQDLSRTAGMQVPGVRALALPSTYDLRKSKKLTSVKNQNPYDTCWSFASLGSLESCLMPGEILDFSEDNMVLTSGFNYPGTLYDAGGQIWMSTAYLVRWGGPVYESDDAYGDNYTPSGLTPRKHVQEVDWIPVRGSALDNDNLKTAVMDYGAVDVSMGWFGASSGSSYYNATTNSYYYDGSGGTNHEVLVVGWDDDYAAANFATTPAGNGAFIVKNSWGTGWGNSGYFYVSYYDSMFGRYTNPSAVFDNAESTGNYAGIYQYDPLGYVTDVGYGGNTGWFANVFTAETTASLSAVGFYTAVPGSSYEVYTGASLATKTLSTSGTIAYMGYHTVTLPSPVAVTNGQPFVVAVKMTTPGYTRPIPVEYQVANYSSAATAAAGQSYVSSTGTSWSDLTTIWNATANVCLKAYVKEPSPGNITGTVTNAGAAGLAGIYVDAYRSNGSGGWDWAANTATTSGGGYDLGGLSAGTYRVKFNDGSGAYALQYYNHKVTAKSADGVSVTAGATTSGINAVLTTAGHVTGTVKNESSVGLVGIYVDASRSDGSGGWELVRVATTTSGGAYDLGGLPTGTYRLEFYDASGTYLGEFYNDKASLASADDVPVTAGATTSGVNAVLAISPGHITGTVKNEGAVGLAGIYVDAYRSDGAGGWDFYSVTSTTSGGAYDLGGLPPDTYRVEFFDGAGTYEGEFYDNKASLAAGDNVTVTAGGTSFGIDATLAVATPLSSITVTAPTGSHQPRPGQQPGGRLDDQPGGVQRRVQPLGGELRQRLVRGQDRARQRR